MNQTKLESAIERTADLITGFLISWAVYEFYIFPKVPAIDSFYVVAIFTAISFFRGYFWRRFFNAGLHKLVHSAVTKLYKAKL